MRRWMGSAGGATASRLGEETISLDSHGKSFSDLILGLPIEA
jgi:hypothetical protein